MEDRVKSYLKRKPHRAAGRLPLWKEAIGVALVVGFCPKSFQHQVSTTE